MSDQPWKIVHIDLADGPTEVAAAETGSLLVLWWRDLPLGTKALLPAETPFRREQMLDLGAQLAARQVGDRSSELKSLPRAGVDGYPRITRDIRARPALLAALDSLSQTPKPSAKSLSVVICTRDRPAMLAACLASLAAQESPAGQVIVIDNSADANARAAAESSPGVTYVHEPRQGLSVARNAGLAAAQGAFIAFTDDDVELKGDWCSQIVRAFDAPEVDAVTGLVLPASLDTPAQRAFELELGGFTSRYTPLVFDGNFLRETERIGPQVWRIGAGANMAFRRASLEGLGGFDERLGAGASGCSEDSEFWYRILAAGGVCLYEPAAVVYHHHRRDWKGLRGQYRAYMRGHVAALVAQADRYGHSGNVRRIFRQLPAYFARTAYDSLQTLNGWRLRLLLEEVLGWTEGLGYLFRTGWRARGGAPQPIFEPELPQVARHA